MILRYSYLKLDNDILSIREEGTTRNVQIQKLSIKNASIFSTRRNGKLQGGNVFAIFLIITFLFIGVHSLLEYINASSSKIIWFSMSLAKLFAQIFAVLCGLLIVLEFLFDFTIISRTIDKILAKKEWTVTFEDENQWYNVIMKNEEAGNDLLNHLNNC